MGHNVFPKVAVINDMTGFGRCALAVEMPIISHFGVQCCPVPTSIWSNHSAFESYYTVDFTPHMEAYVAQWKKLGLKFDGILTGYYGSAVQIDIVKAFIDDFADKKSIVVVDPIMGDNGRKYASTTDLMCQKMEELVAVADVLTPNLTELCILCGTEYEEQLSYDRIKKMCLKLGKSMKNEAGIVVTGIKRGDSIVNLVVENAGNPSKSTFSYVRRKVAGDNRCGTGDVFASVLMGALISGVDFNGAVRKAADFVARCIKESDAAGILKTDGVCFEKVLRYL